jgi:hypothetical protein
MTNLILAAILVASGVVTASVALSTAPVNSYNTDDKLAIYMFCVRENYVEIDVVRYCAML